MGVINSGNHPHQITVFMALTWRYANCMGTHSGNTLHSFCRYNTKTQMGGTKLHFENKS